MRAFSWQQFEVAAPALAASGKRLLIGESGIAIGMIATVSRDGNPRMAPVSPVFALDDVYLSVGAPTPKRYDLINDGRYVLHAFLGENDEEFQVAGRASLVSDRLEISDVHAAITFAYQQKDPVFRLGVERCLWGYWEKVGQPGTYPVRKRWRARQSTRA